MQTVSGGAVTQYLYDGPKLVAEYDGAGNMLRRYVHGPGTDEPLVWYEGGERRWLHHDRQGSVIGWSDHSGAMGEVYAYGPWGEPSSWTGSRFRYTGQIMLPEVQLYHYKARVYDPVAGRFLQTDPVGYKDDLNLYAYVGGDPMNKADPTGEEAFGAIYGAISGGVGGYISSGGDWKGAAVGAVAGGAVGLVLPPGAVSGVAGSYAGQMAGGMLSAKGTVTERATAAFKNLDHGAALGAGVGGAGGKALGTVVAKAVPGRIAPVIGSVVGKSPVNRVAGRTAGAVAEGTVSGVAERAGQRGGPVRQAVDAAGRGVVKAVDTERSYNDQRLRR